MIRFVGLVAVCGALWSCGDEPPSQGILFFNTAMGYGPGPDGTPLKSHGSWIIHPNGRKFLLRIYHLDAGEKRELFSYQVDNPARYPEICVTPTLLGAEKGGILVYAPDRRRIIRAKDAFKDLNYCFEFPRPFAFSCPTLGGTESAAGRPTGEWEMFRFYIRRNSKARFSSAWSEAETLAETRTQNGSVVILTATPEGRLTF